MANRMNAEGEYELLLQEQVLRLVDLADGREPESVVRHELKSSRWRDEFDRYEYTVVELKE